MTFADNIIAGDLLAAGVDFSVGSDQPVPSVSVNKEVILAGGAFGSPHILQRSGVGPSGVLTAANVLVKVDLPGVGANMIDHLSFFYNTYIRQS